MRAVALLLALVACSPPDHGPRFRAAGGPPRPGGTLHIAIIEGVSTLDPAIAYDEISYYVVHPLFDTLVDYAPASTEVIPRLAERWEISPDGKTFRFWMRPNLRYADGRPIVAADIQYSLERALTMPESPFGSFLVDVVGAKAVTEGTKQHCEGIVVTGDRELAITLAVPNLSFLYVMSRGFTTPQRADHNAAAGDQLRRTPLATGPYLLASWDEGQRIVLRRNPYYSDPLRQRIEEVDLRERVPRETQFLMFEAGELDTVEHLSAPDYLAVMSQPAWQPYVHTSPHLSATGSRFNVRVPPFDDRRVRQAFNYAVDKSHISRLLNGRALPAHGILPPGMAGRDDSLAPYPHDPDRARALLAEAGYAQGLDVEYATTPDEQAEAIATSMQADLAEVGVRVRLTFLSFEATAVALASAKGPPFMYCSWVGDFPDPSNFFDPRFHSRMINDDNSVNASFYSNPALDQLLDAARGEWDPAARAAMYRRAEHILYEDVPWLWGYHYTEAEVTQPYVQNYRPHPLWIRDYTEAWLDLGPDGQPVPR
ncbi:ABC transporter substrate-binding protein [soil metagenome]